MHANRRTDKKEVGFFPTMARHIKSHVAADVIL